MSWDIWVEMDTGNGGALGGESRNYTHNCNEMMRRALGAVGKLAELGERHIYALDGMRCADAAALLVPAIGWWKTNRTKLTELNPPNGWGDEPSALEFWSWVQDQCIEHPAAVLRVYG